MANRRARGATVYSTDRGRLCPTCGWPARDCRCSTSVDEPVPDLITAVLRIERAGRRGKTVTVVDGLPRNRAFLKQLAGELKRSCGSGGGVGDGRVEVQGDHRDAVRRLLSDRGWTVKG